MQVISNRVALEDEKCSNDYDKNQQTAQQNMIMKMGELLNKVEEVKKNLKFSGDIYSVLQQLMEVVSGF